MAAKSKNPAAVQLGKLSGESRRRNGTHKPGGFAALPKKRVKELSARGVAARKNSRKKRPGKSLVGLTIPDRQN